MPKHKFKIHTFLLVVTFSLYSLDMNFDQANFELSSRDSLNDEITEISGEAGSSPQPANFMVNGGGFLDYHNVSQALREGHEFEPPSKMPMKNVCQWLGVTFKYTVPAIATGRCYKNDTNCHYFTHRKHNDSDVSFGLKCDPKTCTQIAVYLHIQGQHGSVEPCKNHQDQFKSTEFFTVTCQNQPSNIIVQGSKIPQYNLNVGQKVAYMKVPAECVANDTFAIKFNCASTCLSASKENLYLNMLFLDTQCEVLKHEVIKVKITKNPGRDSQCWKAESPKSPPITAMKDNENIPAYFADLLNPSDMAILQSLDTRTQKIICDSLTRQFQHNSHEQIAMFKQSY